MATEELSLGNENEYLTDTMSVGNPEYGEQAAPFYDDSTIDDLNTLNSHIRNQRKNLKEGKKLDKGYHTMNKTVNGKQQEIEYYETSFCPKATIRNASTGIYETGYRVGTRDEYLFFKVCNSSGDRESREPHILFYQNPEEWERHFKCVCDQEIKEQWQSRYEKEWKLRQIQETK
jgi:hypothetical protein